MFKIFKIILLTFLGTMCIVPIIYLLIFSLAENWFYPQILPSNLTWKHWKYITQSGNNLLSGFILSLFISTSVGLVSTFAGFITSRFIIKSKNKQTWLFLTYLPFVFSPVILGISVFVIFLKLNLAGTFIGVSLAQLLIIYPFATLFFVGFWNNKHKQLEEIAKTMGANSFQVYQYVLIPASTGMLMVCFFQSFLLSWFEYGLSSRIGIGKVKTLTIIVFQYINESNSIYAALACCLIIIPPTVLLILNKRILFRKIA